MEEHNKVSRKFHCHWILDTTIKKYAMRPCESLAYNNIRAMVNEDVDDGPQELIVL